MKKLTEKALKEAIKQTKSSRDMKHSRFEQGYDTIMDEGGSELVERYMELSEELSDIKFQMGEILTDPHNFTDVIPFTNQEVELFFKYLD